MKDTNKDISKGINRKLDTLGRVVIPKEMLRVLNISNRDEVTIKLFNGHIEITKSDEVCYLCNNKEDIIHSKHLNLCRCCLNKMVDKL